MKQEMGWVEWLRFITPLGVSITLFCVGLILTDMKELKGHFTNHLSDHKGFEVRLENRLTTLETIMKGCTNGK